MIQWFPALLLLTAGLISAAGTSQNQPILLTKKGFTLLLDRRQFTLGEPVLLTIIPPDRQTYVFHLQPEKKRPDAVLSGLLRGPRVISLSPAGAGSRRIRLAIETKEGDVHLDMSLRIVR